MKKIGVIPFALLVTVVLGIVLYFHMTTLGKEGISKLKTVSSIPYLYEYDIVAFFRTKDKKPESLLDVPENTDGEKIFFTIPFTDRDMNGCLIDHGENRYTVYADLNGDNSLSDEKPLLSQKKTFNSPDYAIYLFGPSSIKSGNVTTSPFYLFLTNHTFGIHIAPTTIRKGKIRLNGVIHKVVLADLDFDGEYKTYFSPERLNSGGIGYEALCDRLLFDIDSDGKLRNRYFIRMESGPLAKLININRQYYSIQISDKELHASPVSPEFGTLKLNTHKSTMHLYSDTYSCFIDSANTATLPAGNYSVIYSQNHFKDANGNIWTCRSKRSSGPAADFEILANHETSVEFPKSFLLKTTAEYKAEKCEIKLALFSENGKEYTPLIQKNDETVAEPAIKIYDEQNTIVHFDKMKYG
jgi:hypothetical protein